jgi:hypothetical protein
MTHRYSTDVPSRLAQVGSISVGTAKHGRWPLAMGDLRGWCSHGMLGMCVWFGIESKPYDDNWISQATLWLASMRSLADDALWLDGDTLQYMRRYDLDVALPLLCAGIEQQGAVVRWLGVHHLTTRTPSTFSRRI